MANYAGEDIDSSVPDSQVIYEAADDDDDGFLPPVPSAVHDGGAAARNPAEDPDLTQPVYDGATMSVLTAILFLLQLKQEFGITERGMATLLGFLGQLLPADHRLPLSLYRLRSAIGAGNAQQHELHACTRAECSTGHVWPHVPRKDWGQHAADKCPNCKQPRFTVQQAAGKATSPASRVPLPTSPMHGPLLPYIYMK
jgi:hypothetical protein